MMGIKLKAENLATDGLELELRQAGATATLILGPSGGLDGGYEQFPGGFMLQKLRAKKLSLNELQLQLAQGRIQIDSPGALQDVQLDGRADLANHQFVGSAVVRAGELRDISFELAAFRGKLTCRLEGVTYKGSPEGALELHLKRLELSDAEIHYGLRRANIELLVLEDAAVTIHTDRTAAVKCSNASARGISVQDPLGTVEMVALRVSGMALSPHEVHLESIDISGFRGALDEIPLTAKPSKSAGTATPKLPDLPFLDHLRGSLHADVTVDVKLPILKARRATHHVRLPIQDGAINFKTLEKSLSALEDAVLDFEVTRDALILERDLIAGIPFDNQTLITWPLPKVERDRAKRDKMVRLRRLLNYQINPKLLARTPSSKKSAFGLTHLDVNKLHVAIDIDGVSKLDVPGLGQFKLGHGSTPALCGFRVRGSLHYSPAHQRDPTEIEIRLATLAMALDLTSVGGRHVVVKSLDLTSLDDSRLRLQGKVLDQASLTIQRIGITGIHIAPGFPSENLAPA